MEDFQRFEAVCFSRMFTGFRKVEIAENLNVDVRFLTFVFIHAAIELPVAQSL